MEAHRNRGRRLRKSFEHKESLLDKPRVGFAKKRRIRRIVFSICAILVIGAVTYGLSRLEPAAPSVDRSTVFIDEVKRGPMLVDVRGIGTLAPQ